MSERLGRLKTDTGDSTTKLPSKRKKPAAQGQGFLTYNNLSWVEKEEYLEYLSLRCLEGACTATAAGLLVRGKFGLAVEYSFLQKLAKTPMDAEHKRVRALRKR